jgi:drug/metabolite transporter (DMT)-like permease
VPTILFGALYHGRRYSPSDFIAISLMMFGMAIFCVTDAATFKHFHPNGIGMVVVAIVADAVSSAVQEKVKLDPNPDHFVSLNPPPSTPKP